MSDNQHENKRNLATGEIPCNYSFMFYDHPVYSSNFVYGIEGRETEESSPNSGEAVDEPVESWGWVNNVDRNY